MDNQINEDMNSISKHVSSALIQFTAWSVVLVVLALSWAGIVYSLSVVKTCLAG